MQHPERNYSYVLGYGKGREEGYRLGSLVGWAFGIGTFFALWFLVNHGWFGLA